MAWRLGLVAAILLCGSAAFAGEESATQLRIVTDRPDGVYVAGEAATFAFELTDGGRPVPAAPLRCELSTDGFRTSEARTVEVVDGRAEVTAGRDVPCVLCVRATWERDGEPAVRATGGAAFSPERIEPSMPPPDDFDAFWRAQVARLADVPMNAVVEPLESPTDRADVWNVRLDSVGGQHVYGYLARPKGEGPFPALVCFRSAGVAPISKEWAAGRAHWQGPMLVFSINAHSILNEQPPEYYRQMGEGPLRGYPHQGRDSRETSYFLGMYLRCVRAVEFVASHPDWDGKHLIVYGSSQGGGQALVAGGLCPQVSAVCACVPAMCDHTAPVSPHHAAGWPRLVSVDRASGVADPAQLEAARYFDAVNFARRITAPTLVGAGLLDLTCPASSVCAACNVMTCPKQVTLDPLTGHAAGPGWQKASQEFIPREMTR
ncbi:MAG: acetylxylan esterase [Candidatus Brocadiaceae bacterium]|nr:acetylxylan esterase [Candidatus Brocadiaceae bacterium]